MLPEFRNEPNIDFSLEANCEGFRQALNQVRADFGKTYPMVIGGQEVRLDAVFPSVNPARPDEVLGYFADGTAAHADQATEAAAAAFETWQYTPAEDRVRYVLRAAAAMRRRKFEFCAMLVLEAGKSWAEADGDVCEAIDFMEYYARQMLRLADSSAMLGPSPGEQLQLTYVPLGVTAVIPPWNFPDAILTGLMAAALVAGNTVVLKPAEQTPYTGYKVAELFWQLDLPAGVLNFVTGPGEVVGARMVEHPKTRIIAFTGSRAVGVGIYEKAARLQPGQKWLKRAILELGGKNPVVVDETADLDAAASGIVAGAFGYQGQKCSAGSRAIIVDSVYDTLRDKIVALAKQIRTRFDGRIRRDVHGAGDRPGSGAEDQQLSRDRPAGRHAAAGRDHAGRPERGLLLRADDLWRGQPEGAHRPGRNLRPGAGADPRERLRRGAGRSPTIPNTA